MQSNEVVAHPESGKAALKVVSYVELDVAQLSQAVAEAEAACASAVEAKRAHDEQATTLTDNVTKAEADLEDKKSQLEASTAINSQLETTSEDGASEQDAGAETPGDAPAGDSGSAEDSGDGSVEVPVTVGETSDNY